jgi:hypothetical protein
MALGRYQWLFIIEETRSSPSDSIILNSQAEMSQRQRRL